MALDILSISIRIPAAQRKGDQTVSFYRLKYLADQGHKVRVICFGNMSSLQDKSDIQRLEELGIVVYLIQHSKIEAIFNVLAGLLFSSIPLQVSWYYSRKMKHKISNLIEQFVPDFVYCVTCRPVKNIPDTKCNLYVDFIDSLALNFFRRAEKAKPLLKPIMQIESKRLLSFEQHVAQISAESSVVSEIDAKFIGTNFVKVLPLGIDIEFESYTPRKLSEKPYLVFTGNMSYSPNNEAVMWFIKNVWSELQVVFPDLKLIIAGRSPSKNLIHIAKFDASICLLGEVDSVRKIIENATVAIAPMQSGSGMQNKVLEAMACSVPVVTTELGLGSIAAVDGKDVLVANSDRSFNLLITSLIKDVDLNMRVGAYGREYVTKYHLWKDVNEKFFKSASSTLQEGGLHGASKNSNS